ncbi:MAG: 50S ribosomal protein L11 methyltransferase [Opitutaceae bacterium]|nr:50S ribosomal protein L11 methyltransferase [Opitutaceae bacterium]
MLEDEDWRESYKEHFKSWRFRGLHWVPLWEKESYVVPDGEAVVWLDPGMAFGTGNHETTRLCVERLVEYAYRQIDAGIDLNTMDIVDAGCGSGILILSASKLGFEKLRAFDNDAEAVRISEENATMNNASDSICFEVADLTNGFNAGKADFLMANILANILAENAIKLIDALKPGGQLVLSGILTREVDEVRAAFAVDLRVEECGSRDLGEWSDLVFNRTKK